MGLALLLGLALFCFVNVVLFRAIQPRTLATKRDCFARTVVIRISELINVRSASEDTELPFPVFELREMILTERPYWHFYKMFIANSVNVSVFVWRAWTFDIERWSVASIYHTSEFTDRCWRLPNILDKDVKSRRCFGVEYRSNRLRPVAINPRMGQNRFQADLKMLLGGAQRLSGIGRTRLCGFGRALRGMRDVYVGACENAIGSCERRERVGLVFEKAIKSQVGNLLISGRNPSVIELSLHYPELPIYKDGPDDRSRYQRGIKESLKGIEEWEAENLFVAVVPLLIATLACIAAAFTSAAVGWSDRRIGGWWFWLLLVAGCAIAVHVANLLANDVTRRPSRVSSAHASARPACPRGTARS